MNDTCLIETQNDDMSTHCLCQTRFPVGVNWLIYNKCFGEDVEMFGASCSSGGEEIRSNVNKGNYYDKKQ